MIPERFVRIVWKAVGISVATVFVVGIAFQSLTIEFHGKEEHLQTVKESRTLWLGGMGIIPVTIFLVLLGFLAVGTRYIADDLNIGLGRLMDSLASVLVRISSAVTEIKEAVRFTR